MADKAKTLKQIFGPRGAAKVRRLLISEYQKYIINCLKSGAEAKQFEEWLKELNR